MLLLIGAILVAMLWGVSIWLWATGMFPWLCMALYLAHLMVFFFIARPMGERYRDPVLKTALLSMAFGYLYVLWRRKRAASEQLRQEDGGTDPAAGTIDPPTGTVYKNAPQETPRKTEQAAPAAAPQQTSAHTGEGAEPIAKDEISQERG